MTPRLLRIVLLAVACATWVTPRQLRAAPAPVGPLGDAARIDVAGCQKMTADQIRAGLRSSAPVQVASTPSAPLDDYLETLRRQTVLGYHCAGFPNAAIAVARQGDRVRITVEEGPRYLAGDVQLNNAPDVDAGKLVAFLTTEERASHLPVRVNAADGSIRLYTIDQPQTRPAPFWSPGSPAPFDLPTDERLRKEVRDGLAHQGFFWPEFKLTRTTAGDRAQLVIDFTTQGPRATLGEIEVRGVNRNRPDEVIRLIGLAPGAALDVPALEAVHQRLWNSGRFFLHDLTARAPAAAAPGRVNLLVDLTEHDRATRLRDDLSPTEIALLRCRAWLIRALEGGQDLTATVGAHDGTTVDVAFNAGQGVIASYRPAREPSAGAPPPDDVGVAFTVERTGLFSTAGNRKLIVRDSGRGVAGKITFLPSYPNPDGDRVHFLAGATLSSEAGGRPFRLDVSLAPVCFIDLAHGGAAKSPIDVDLADGVFTVRAKTFGFRFKAETGELVEMTYQNSEGRFRVTPQPGALGRAAARIDAISAPNSYDPARPLASSLAFAAQTAVLAAPTLTPRATPAQRVAAAAALRKLLDAKAMREIAEPWARFPRPARFTDFFIPIDPRAAAAAEANPLALLAELVPWCDLFFARESWPWTLARDSILVTTGRARHTDTEARRVFQSPDVGPVGFLLAASLYARAGDNVTCRLFAKRGLERLTFDSFATDCRTLFGNGSAQAAALSAMLNSLRELSDPELDALGAILPEGFGGAPKMLAAFQKAAPADAPHGLPEPLQQALWDGGLKAWIEASLQKYADAR